MGSELESEQVSSNPAPVDGVNTAQLIEDALKAGQPLKLRGVKAPTTQSSSEQTRQNALRRESEQEALAVAKAKEAAAAKLNADEAYNKLSKSEKVDYWFNKLDGSIAGKRDGVIDAREAEYSELNSRVPRIAGLVDQWGVDENITKEDMARYIDLQDYAKRDFPELLRKTRPQLDFDDRQAASDLLSAVVDDDRSRFVKRINDLYKQDSERSVRALRGLFRAFDNHDNVFLFDEDGGSVRLAYATSRTRYSFHLCEFWSVNSKGEFGPYYGAAREGETFRDLGNTFIFRWKETRHQ